VELDIPSISAIIAAAGVLVGVVIAVVELRHLVKQRRTDSYWRIISTFNTREYLEAILELWTLDYKDYDDFTSKYGTPLSRKNSTWVSISMVCDLFEAAAYLYRNGLLEYDTVLQIPLTPTWEKVKTIAEGARKQLGLGGMWKDFEWLYDQMQMRRQKIQQEGVSHG